MKPRTRYGILDDFGEVIRWVWDKPSSHYKYITACNAITEMKCAALQKMRQNGHTTIAWVVVGNTKPLR